MLFHTGAPISKALAALERAIALDPSFGIAYQHIWHLYRQAGPHEEAIARARSPVQEDPGNPAWHEALVASVASRGRPGEVDSALALTLERAEAPRARERTYGIAGWAAVTRGSALEGLELLEKAQATGVEDPSAWTSASLAWAEAGLGNREEFERLLEARLARGAPEMQSRLFSSLGWSDLVGGADPAAAALLQGDAREAERWCRERIEQGQVGAPVHRWLSYALAEQGRFAEAERAARRAWAQSGSKASCTQLAWVLIEGDRDVEQGIELARTACDSIAPNAYETAWTLPFTPSPEHCLALAEIRQGRTAEGVRLLEEAARLRPDRSRIREDLATARAKV